jgi:hypothetical protein
MSIRPHVNARNYSLLAAIAQLGLGVAAALVGSFLVAHSVKTHAFGMPALVGLICGIAGLGRALIVLFEILAQRHR